MNVATAAALLLLICLLSAVSIAQQSATANLSGIVTDPQGAVVAGAQVTATQKATGASADDEHAEGLLPRPAQPISVKVQLRFVKVSQSPLLLSRAERDTMSGLKSLANVVRNSARR